MRRAVLRDRCDPEFPVRLHPFRPTPWLIGIPEESDTFVPITDESAAA